MIPTDTAHALESTAASAVAVAGRLGAEEAEASVTFEEGLAVTVRMNELEQVKRQRRRRLLVTVYRGKRKGTATTTDFTAAAVDSIVSKALSIASFTAEDVDSGLAESNLMAKSYPSIELYFPWDLSIEEAAQLAERTEGAALAFDQRITNSLGATVGSRWDYRVYANSHGFLGSYPTSTQSITCRVAAKTNQSFERDGWYSVSRSPRDLDAPEVVGAEAARRAVRRLGARSISTRKVPVLFPAELAKELFGHFVAALQGKAQCSRGSFLAGAAGTQVLPSFVDVEEDPLIARGLASAPFDAEGVATGRRELVTAGVLQGYMLSCYWGRRLGLPTTANAGGAHNVLVRPTAGPLQSLIAGCDRAFLLGELLGRGVNIVTGNYSRGAMGFWVERGAIAYPVNEVTVAGRLSDVFKGIGAVGNDIDARGVVRCGSVLVEGLTLAGR